MSHSAHGYDSRSSASSTAVPLLFSVDASSSANARHAPASSFAAPLAAMPRGMIDAPGGFMFGIEQHQTYRSVMLPHRASVTSQQGFNPLAQDGYLARAVDVSAYTRVPEPQQNWFQQAQPTSVYQQQAYGAFDSFGAPQKHASLTSSSTPAHFHTDAFTSSMKQLELPRLEAMLLSVPTPTTATAATPELDLPAMPLYLEATSFSCPQNAHVWSDLKSHLQQAGVIVAQDDATKYQIKCHSTIGISCSEFNIRCYNGHYREVGVATAAAPGETAGPASSSGSFFTIEWQRRAGCGYGFMQLFRHVLATLAAHFSSLKFDSKIAPAGGPVASEEEAEPGSAPEPAADDEIEIDMSDVDMAALAMLCLSRNGTASTSTATAACFSPAPACDKSSLYDSLLDLLASDASEAQVAGMNALALCLDGAHPRAGELLAEVAQKLHNGQDAEVRQAAARLVAQAASTEGASAAAVVHCLPTVLAQLTSGSSSSGVTGDSFAGAFACATQKSLLRSCVALSASVPAALDDVAGGGVLASSRLKRELLRACAHADEETRGLAMQAVRTIQV